MEVSVPQYMITAVANAAFQLNLVITDSKYDALIDALVKAVTTLEQNAIVVSDSWN